MAALSRLQHPSLGDRAGFETLLGEFHDWTIEVEFRGLVPVMALAERAGLSALIGERVGFKSVKVRSAGGEPGGEADLDHRGDGRGGGLHR